MFIIYFQKICLLNVRGYKQITHKTIEYSIIRIDYVFANNEYLETWSLKRLETVDNNASDHNMVIATFSKKEI